MRALLLICLLGLLSAAARAEAPHPLEGTILDLAADEPIGREELVARLADADIVVLGEIHDNPAHHRAQAWLAARLQPAGMAFEMIPETREAEIAEFLAAGGAPGEIGPAIGWEQSGWPDWSLYRPIFEAWRPAVYTGGGMDRADLMRAGSEGAAAVVSDPRFAPVLGRAPDGATQAAMVDEMVAAHCGSLPREAATGMVEVQRLRDASFAAAALRARELAGGGPAVLITGNGHARTDRGVPAYLAEVSPELSVLSVGLLETAPDAPPPTDGDLPFDFAWFTAPAERPDPCAAFDRMGR